MWQDYSVVTSGCDVDRAGFWRVVVWLGISVHSNCDNLHEFHSNIQINPHCTNKATKNKKIKLCKWSRALKETEKSSSLENSETQREKALLANGSRGLASLRPLVQPFKIERRFFGRGANFHIALKSFPEAHYISMCPALQPASRPCLTAESGAD